MKDFNADAIIEKVRNAKRGFGTMTMALFRAEEPHAGERKEDMGGWDYIELVKAGAGEYQSSAVCLDNPKELIGMTLNEALSLPHVQHLRRHWHRAKLTKDGDVVSLTC